VKTRLTTAALSIAALVISAPLFAQNQNDVHPWLEDDFIVNLGGFLPNKDFKIRVDGAVPGREIDFDESVDVTNDDTTGSLWFRWKFGDKWSVAGQYFATDDSGEAVLADDVFWGDNMLQAGSNVGAGVNVDLARVFFGRTFFTTAPQHEFGLGAGLHWLQIEAFLEGEVFVNDQSTGFRRETVSADLPLPNIGAWYWYSLSPRWLLTSRLDWFSASIGDYSGSLWNASVGVNFQPWEHVGFGLSYQMFQVDVDIDKSDWHGNAELTYSGPFLSVDFNW
jgi:hypothetical protein